MRPSTNPLLLWVGPLGQRRLDTHGLSHDRGRAQRANHGAAEDVGHRRCSARPVRPVRPVPVLVPVLVATAAAAAAATSAAAVGALKPREVREACREPDALSKAAFSEVWVGLSTPPVRGRGQLFFRVVGTLRACGREARISKLVKKKSLF